MLHNNNRMGDILIWQELGKFGSSNISIPCRKVSVTSIPESHEYICNNSRITEIEPDDGEYIMMYSESDLQNKSCCQEILQLDCNFCVWFNMDNIIREILKSYSRKKKYITIDDKIIDDINKQLYMDFDRLELYLNSERCSRDIFLKFCRKYQKYHHPVMRNMENLLIMLSTQSSFYYSYSVVNKIYADPDKGIHVVSTTDYMEKLPSPKKNDNPVVEIIDNGMEVDMIFKKLYTIIDVNNEKIINQYETVMVFTIKLANNYVFHYCKTNIGVLNIMDSNRTGDFFKNIE